MGKRSKRKQVKKRLSRLESKWQKVKHFKTPPLFKDNFGNTISPHEVVFPILRKTSDNNFVFVGTGFFIHPAGGFVTARHCLYKNDKYDEKCYAIQTIGYEHILRKIQYFEAHPNADVGVGMLKGQLLSNITRQEILRPSLIITSKKIEINEPISTLSFSRMKINKNQVGTFRCDMSTGKVIDYFKDGTSQLKDECFQTDMHIPTMASGGPVLRGNKIIGVNSTSFTVPLHQDPISFITPISKVFDLILKDSDQKKTTINELAESGYMIIEK